MKTSKALRILAIVMIAVLSCFVFTGKKVMAIVDDGIEETFEPTTEENKEKKYPKLSRKERKFAEETAERLKMLQR